MQVVRISTDSFFIRAEKGNLIVSRFYFGMSLSDAVDAFKVSYAAE